MLTGPDEVRNSLLAENLLIGECNLGNQNAVGLLLALYQKGNYPVDPDPEKVNLLRELMKPAGASEGRDEWIDILIGGGILAVAAVGIYFAAKRFMKK
jgi:hypothetical protein